MLPLPRFAFFGVISLILVGGQSVFSQEGDDFSDTLVYTKWSGDLNIPDPVSVSLDNEGRVYVTQTQRRKIQDLDIRLNMDWVVNDISLDSVEAKRSFYRDRLSAENSAANSQRILDMNSDGVYDYRDLTVLSEYIHLVEDTDKDGTADRINLFAEGFNTDVTGIAAGVLWDDGDVYATIVPDLWKLRDTDNDGIADEREILATGFAMHIAYAGHDMHGLIKGPDGKIYWSIGDKGVNSTSQEGKHFYYPNQGAVMRCNPDGSDFEVFAYGLRNVQEIAFDEYGNLFGVDNDSDQRGETERLVYIVEGLDAAWRCNYQYRKGDYNPWMEESLHIPHTDSQPAYFVPAIQNYVDGPAGFVFNPGTALNSQYKDYFFLNGTMRGAQYAFQLEEDGASFVMKNSHQIGEGIPLVGLAVGPDGALYAPDWGGGYPLNQKGAIWKIDDNSNDERSIRIEVANLLASNFGEVSASRLQTLLGHVDQRIRLRAQFELVERKEIKTLILSAGEGERIHRIHAIWGLGQLARKNNQQALARLLAILNDKDSEIQVQVTKVLADLEKGSFDAKVLVPLLASQEPRVSFQAGLAIGNHELESAFDEVVSMIERNNGNDLYLRHAGIVALRGVGGAARLVDHSSEEVRLCAVVALRRDRDPKIAAFLNDSSKSVVREAALAIHDDLSIPEALPQLAGLIEDLKSEDKALTYRIINANLRLGEQDNARAVTAYLADESMDSNLRIEAVNALSAWMDPPVLDRVEGRYRAYEKREPIALIEMLTPVFNQLLHSNNGALVSAIVETAEQMKLPLEAASLTDLLRNEHAPAPLRALALESLNSEEAIEFGLNSNVVELRAKAMSKLALSDPQRAAPFLAETLESSQHAFEKQRALAALSSIDSNEADVAISIWASRLANGTVEEDLQLDVIEAVTQRGFTKEIEIFDSKRDNSDPIGGYIESLEGGDIAMGEQIAKTHIAAQCVRCHRLLNEQGSRIGPRLGRNGKIDSRYLLRALVAPGADIANGYGFVSIVLKDGTSLVGSLGKEEAGIIELFMMDGSAKLIEKAMIESMTKPISTMPPMGGMLSKRELRDLVAYLQKIGERSRREP